MTFETADDVLEHFGVKGMKWGVRKQRTTSSSSGGSKKEGMSAKKKRAIQVAVVGGALVAGVLLAHQGRTRLSSTGSAASRGSSVAGRILSSRGRTSARNVSSAPKITAAQRRQIAQIRAGRRQAAATAATIRNDMARLVREANADLRARDNAIGIPFSERSYLTEWD